MILVIGILSIFFILMVAPIHAMILPEIMVVESLKVPRLTTLCLNVLKNRKLKKSKTNQLKKLETFLLPAQLERVVKAYQPLKQNTINEQLQTFIDMADEENINNAFRYLATKKISNRDFLFDCMILTYSRYNKSLDFEAPNNKTGDIDTEFLKHQVTRSSSVPQDRLPTLGSSYNKKIRLYFYIAKQCRMISWMYERDFDARINTARIRYLEKIDRIPFACFCFSCYRVIGIFFDCSWTDYRNSNFRLIERPNTNGNLKQGISSLIDIHSMHFQLPYFPNGIRRNCY